MALKDWKKIQDGSVFPFIDVYTKSAKPEKLLKVGITKSSGSMGENVTWSVVYDNQITKKKINEKRFQRKKSER